MLSIEQRWYDQQVRVDWTNHKINASAVEEKCGVFRVPSMDAGLGPCGEPASHKIGEEGSNPVVHNLTQYVCCTHFAMIMGPASPCGPV